MAQSAPVPGCGCQPCQQVTVGPATTVQLNMGYITGVQWTDGTGPGVIVPQRPPRTPGISGFSEAGGADLAAGAITGYRSWSLSAPDFCRDPLSAERHWPWYPLLGALGKWSPGLNEAACLAQRPGGPPAHDDPLPARECGCGFWAYWKLARYPVAGTGGIPVSGVIEGSGRTRIGELGFRCARARIAALHVPSARVRELIRGCCPGLYLEDWAEAWLAVIADRLDQMYPEARVFETQAAMLAAFPLDPEYAGQDEAVT